MSIMCCDDHGKWDSDVWSECPNCMFREVPAQQRKVYYGLPVVEWFFLGCLSVLVVGMVLVVIYGRC